MAGLNLVPVESQAPRVYVRPNIGNPKSFFTNHLQPRDRDVEARMPLGFPDIRKHSKTKPSHLTVSTRFNPKPPGKSNSVSSTSEGVDMAAPLVDNAKATVGLAVVVTTKPSRHNARDNKTLTDSLLSTTKTPFHRYLPPVRCTNPSSLVQNPGSDAESPELD